MRWELEIENSWLIVVSNSERLNQLSILFKQNRGKHLAITKLLNAYVDFTSNSNLSYPPLKLLCLYIKEVEMEAWKKFFEEDNTKS